MTGTQLGAIWVPNHGAMTFGWAKRPDVDPGSSLIARRFESGRVKHAGALPRLCQPYRAQTKGKVERFIGYLKRNFWVPFVATQRQAGVLPDKHSANAAVARWLGEVANARLHATTKSVPAERLIIEKPKRQDVPAAYRGRSARVALAVPERKHVIGYQHPLSVYDSLFAPSASPAESRPEGAGDVSPEIVA